MQLATSMGYRGNFKDSVRHVQDLERAGLDIVWIAEAYSFDAISRVGYLAAMTDHVRIGTGIVNVYSRSAAAMGQTAAGCDMVSDGRFILGLGASGPQVVEGFHGIAYEKPMQRIKEYIDVVRMTLRREPLVYDGKLVHLPLPPGQGTGLGKPLKLINHPVRPAVPIWWASLQGLSVTETAANADGWLPAFFEPERSHQVWGDELKAGAARRDPSLAPLEISAGGLLAIGEELVGDAQAEVLDAGRHDIALYWGGMGARGKNFYNDLARRYGYEAEAIEIQDLYLDGRTSEAEAKVPLEFLQKSNLVGPPGHLKERIDAYKEAGVTVLNVRPVGTDHVRAIEQLRTLVDD